MTQDQTDVASLDPHLDDAKLWASGLGYFVFRVLSRSSKPITEWSVDFFPLPEECKRMLRRCPRCLHAFYVELEVEADNFRKMGDGQLPCPDTHDLIAYTSGSLRQPDLNRVQRHLEEMKCGACHAYITMWH